MLLGYEVVQRAQPRRRRLHEHGHAGHRPTTVRCRRTSTSRATTRRGRRPATSPSTRTGSTPSPPRPRRRRPTSTAGTTDERQRGPRRHRSPQREQRRRLPGWVDQTPVLAGRRADGRSEVVTRPTDGRAPSRSPPRASTTVTYFATDAAGNDGGATASTPSASTAPARDRRAAVRGVQHLAAQPRDAAGCGRDRERCPLRRRRRRAPGDGRRRRSARTTSSSTPDGAGGFAVWLRAERRGNERNGRVYTIDATATDRAGNVQTATTTCVVPARPGQRSERPPPV